MKTPAFGERPLLLGDVKNIVYDGLLCTAICVGHSRTGGLFIQEIDYHTDPEDIEIYEVSPSHYFDDTQEGRNAAVELWRGKSPAPQSVIKEKEVGDV